MLNICLCGAQAGYLHKDCPFPYYGNAENKIQEWLLAKEKMQSSKSKEINEGIKLINQLNVRSERKIYLSENWRTMADDLKDELKSKGEMEAQK